MTSTKKTGLKYYSSVLFKGSIAQTLSHGATNLVSLLLLPIITAYLSPNDFGIFSMVGTVATFLSLIYNPGILSATMRLYHDTNSETERKIIIGSAMKFVNYFPLICTAFFLIVGPLVFPLVFSKFSFYPWGVFAIILAYFTQNNRMWSTLMSLEYKVYITALYSFLSIILGMTVTLVLVVGFKLGALGKVIGMFPPTLLIYFIAIHAINKYSEGLWSFGSIKNQLKLGFPLIIAIWSYSILDIADRYLLERMVDIESVGIYSLGYKLAQMPMFFVMGARQLWNPVFYDNMNKKDYKTVSRLAEAYIVLISLVNVFVILYAKEITLLLINKRYENAIPIIGVIVIGIYFSAMLTITNSILGFKKQFGTTSVIAFIAAVTNIGLNLLLIPKYGIMASAFATAVSYFIYLFMGLWRSREVLSYLKFMPAFLLSLLAIILAYVLTLQFTVYRICIVDVSIKMLFILMYVVLIFALRIMSYSDVKSVVSLIKNRFGKKND